MGFLTGKTVLITGGGRAVLSSGKAGSIGYGIATAYAKEGANIVITGRNVAKLQDAKEELERLYGVRVLPVQADVTEGADNEANIQKVIDLLKTKSFDAIIIQVSRDYAIFTGSTASKEVAAVQNIADAAEQYAPGAKLIFMVGIDRDYATTGWNSKYSNAGISSQTALRSKMMNYYETKIAAAADGVCCDLITAFSEAEKAGIKVREAATPDYPNVQGGYLIACMNYAHITGKSPVGLTTVTSASGSVTAAEAATLQAIAAEIVIGK